MSEAADLLRAAEREHAARLLEVCQAAYRIGYSQEYVRRLIRSGKLRAKRIGGPRSHWRIKSGDLDAFIAAQHTTGCDEAEHHG